MFSAVPCPQAPPSALPDVTPRPWGGRAALPRVALAAPSQWGWGPCSCCLCAAPGPSGWGGKVWGCCMGAETASLPSLDPCYSSGWALGAPKCWSQPPARAALHAGLAGAWPRPPQRALPARTDPPGATQLRGELLWQQPGACGLGSGQGCLLCSKAALPWARATWLLRQHGRSLHARGRAVLTSSLRERGHGEAATAGLAGLQPVPWGSPGPCAGVTPLPPCCGAAPRRCPCGCGAACRAGCCGRVVGPSSHTLPRSSGPPQLAARGLRLWLMLKPTDVSAGPCLLPAAPLLGAVLLSFPERDLPGPRS